MQTIAKITSNDYPDLLAAVDEGVSQRELARRYGCAPSLIARHVGKAKRLRELSDREEESETELSVEPMESSMREILAARIRDPRTSPRENADIFDGLAIKSNRFASSQYVPAEQVAEIFPGEVRLKITSAEAAALQPFTEPPPQEQILPEKAPLGRRVSNWLREPLAAVPADARVELPSAAHTSCRLSALKRRSAAKEST